MTVAPATLSQMIASTRFEAAQKAIVGTLRDLLRGVTIATHPGKLDINDYLAKAIVTAPGVAVGWSRIRAVRDLGGTYGLPIDWVAYIVAEDYADRAINRSVERGVVANAIGAQLLRILADADTASWGLPAISPPLPDPEPEMRPVFTMKTAEQASGLYVVTWTQVLLFEGTPTFGGLNPSARQIPEGMEFDLPEGDLPTEILAFLRGGDAPTGGEP